MSRIEVHVRIRPRLQQLGETFQPLAARKYSETVVALDAPGATGATSSTESSAQQAVPSRGTTPKRCTTPTQSSRPTTPRTPIPKSPVETPIGTPARIGGQTEAKPQPTKQQLYNFDGVFDADETQYDVFEATALDIIDGALEGRSGAVMCYGPTGTGKTHTLLGTGAPPPELPSSDAKSAVQRQEELGNLGILPRTIMTLLEQMESQKRSSAKGAIQLDSITLTAVEIYQDDARDLLAPGRRSSLPVKFSDQGGLCDMLKPFTQKSISTVGEYRKCAASIAEHRTVCSHEKNHQSSRSHAIFFVILKLKSAANSNTMSSCIALVDLAGSERVKRSQVEGQALQEAQAINKSLSSLCTVVHALYNQASHIPYRDSRLTRILRPCFEQGQLVTIVHVPPGAAGCDEAGVTLKFAERMKQVALADTGAKNSKVLFTQEELQLEQDALSAQRVYMELCSELRLCNASTGYVIRRIAQCAAKYPNDDRYAQAFQLQREKEEDDRIMNKIRDELVQKRMGPVRQRVLNMRRQLERVGDELRQSATELAALEVKEAAREEEEEELTQATKKAKRSKQVAKKAKSTLEDHVRLCKNALKELEQKLKFVELENEHRNDAHELAQLKKDIASLNESMPLCEKQDADLALLVEEACRVRRDYISSYCDSLASNRSLKLLSGKCERLLSKLSSREKEAKSATGTLSSSAGVATSEQWQMPLVLSSGAVVTEAPSILGCYDDEEALLACAQDALLRGIAVEVISVESMIVSSQIAAESIGYRILRLNSIGSGLLLENSAAKESSAADNSSITDSPAPKPAASAGSRRHLAAAAGTNDSVFIPLSIGAAVVRIGQQQRARSPSPGATKGRTTPTRCITPPRTAPLRSLNRSSINQLSRPAQPPPVTKPPPDTPTVFEVDVDSDTANHSLIFKLKAGNGRVLEKYLIQFFTAEDMEAAVFGISSALRGIAKKAKTVPKRSPLRPNSARSSSTGASSGGAGRIASCTPPASRPTGIGGFTKPLELRCSWCHDRSEGWALPKDTISELSRAIRTLAEDICNSSNIDSAHCSSSTIQVKETVTLNQVRSLHCSALDVDVFRLMANWDKIILAVCRGAAEGNRFRESSEGRRSGSLGSSISQRGTSDEAERPAMLPSFHFPPIPPHLRSMAPAGALH